MTDACRAKRRLALYFVIFSWVLAVGLGRTAFAEETLPLRFCADPDNLPFSSASEATPGLYIELGREIAREMGRPFQPVWVPTYYVKRQVRMKLLAGQCDGFIGLPDDAGFMAPRVIMSRPFLRLGYALVLPRGMRVASLSDFSGRRVAVQLSTPPQDLLASRSDILAVTVLSANEATQAIVDGKADAAFVWGASAGWFNKTMLQDGFNVLPIEGVGMGWNVGIGFPRDQTVLRDQINETLAKIAQSLPTLMSKYGLPQEAMHTLAAESLSSPPLAVVPGSGLGIDEHSESSEAVLAHSSLAVSDLGHKLFNNHCSHCHGPDAVQGERRRNLRLLQRKYGDEVRQAFMATVTQGRVQKGMPNWSGILSGEDFNEIFAFLLSVQEH